MLFREQPDAHFNRKQLQPHGLGVQHHDIENKRIVKSQNTTCVSLTRHSGPVLLMNELICIEMPLNADGAWAAAPAIAIYMVILLLLKEKLHTIDQEKYIRVAKINGTWWFSICQRLFRNHEQQRRKMKTSRRVETLNFSIHIECRNEGSFTRCRFHLSNIFYDLSFSGSCNDK